MNKYQITYCTVFSAWQLLLRDGKVFSFTVLFRVDAHKHTTHTCIFLGEYLSKEAHLTFLSLMPSEGYGFLLLNRIQDGNSKVSLLLCSSFQIKVTTLVLFRTIHFFMQRKTEQSVPSPKNSILPCKNRVHSLVLSLQSSYSSSFCFASQIRASCFSHSCFRSSSDKDNQWEMFPFIISPNITSCTF